MALCYGVTAWWGAAMVEGEFCQMGCDGGRWSAVMRQLHKMLRMNGELGRTRAGGEPNKSGFPGGPSWHKAWGSTAAPAAGIPLPPIAWAAPR